MERAKLTHDHLRENAESLANFQEHIKTLWSQRNLLINRVNAYESEAQLPLTQLRPLPDPTTLEDVLKLTRDAIIVYGDPMLECGFNTLVAHLQQQAAIAQRYLPKVETKKPALVGPPTRTGWDADGCDTE